MFPEDRNKTIVKVQSPQESKIDRFYRYTNFLTRVLLLTLILFSIWAAITIYKQNQFFASLPVKGKNKTSKELNWITLKDLEKYETFIFDIDGTIKDGDGFLPEARNFLEKLEKQNRTIILISNNDKDSLDQQAKKYGIPAKNIVIPLLVLKKYAADRLKSRRALVFAPGPVKDWLEKKMNVTLLNNEFPIEKGEYTDPDKVLKAVEEKPDFVIMDSFPDYNLEIIDRIANILERDNAELFLLSADPTLRTKNNLLLAEAAAIYEAVKVISGRNATIFGKPSENYSRFLREEFNLTKKAIIFGDSMMADMVTANKLGIDSCFMPETGVDNEEKWRRFYEEGKMDRRPTYKGSFSHLMESS